MSSRNRTIAVSSPDPRGYLTTGFESAGAGRRCKLADTERAAVLQTCNSMLAKRAVMHRRSLILGSVVADLKEMEKKRKDTRKKCDLGTGRTSVLSRWHMDCKMQIGLTAQRRLLAAMQLACDAVALIVDTMLPVGTLSAGAKLDNYHAALSALDAGSYAGGLVTYETALFVNDEFNQNRLFDKELTFDTIGPLSLENLFKEFNDLMMWEKQLTDDLNRIDCPTATERRVAKKLGRGVIARELEALNLIGESILVPALRWRE
jgi:hypothetical protein